MALDHTDVDYWMIPGPYNTAAMSYLAGLEHDPGNAELEDGRRCAMDEVEKSPLGAEATENLTENLRPGARRHPGRPRHATAPGRLDF